MTIKKWMGQNKQEKSNIKSKPHNIYYIFENSWF